MGAGAEVVDSVSGFGELFDGILVGLMLVEKRIEVVLVEFYRGKGIAAFDGPTTAVARDRLFKVCHTGNSVGRNQRHLDSALERSLRLRQKSPARCRSVFLGSVSSSKLYSVDFVQL